MARPAYMTRTMRLTRFALGAYLGLVILFLIAPILAIVPLSFSAGSFLHYPLPGLSLRWYAEFFSSSFWLPALREQHHRRPLRHAAGDRAGDARRHRPVARAPFRCAPSSSSC